MVACQPTDNARYFREQPVLLGEVLSEDENKDLVEKYFAYQRITSLEEYIVLSQNPAQPEVQIFRRSEGWDDVETHRDSAAQFTLRSVGLTLTLSDLYVALRASACPAPCRGPGMSTKGAKTSQPRATPWESDPITSQP